MRGRKRINIPIWYQQNRLKELRTANNYTQATVAEQINCVTKTYQQYERGENFPTLEYADALASLYGVSIDYLLGRSNFRKIENEYINKITGLSENSIETLINNHMESKLLSNHNPIASVINFLLLPEHVKRNSGGLLHLIGAYLTTDLEKNISGIPDNTITAKGVNGSGFQLNATELLHGGLLGMIQEKLVAYHMEIQQKKGIE